MMLNGGCFSLEVLEAVSHLKCPENTEPSSKQVFVQVDPKAHYLVKLSVVPGGHHVGIDPNRIYLAYVYVNDQYFGYRQCLNPRDPTPVICSTMIDRNEPIRFQQANLVNSHTNILHMGKVVVKIYEGIADGRQSAFGNNLVATAAYQPGRFVETLTIHCCATPEAGHAYLSAPDQERLRMALHPKRPSATNENEGPTASSFKRVKTEAGYVNAVNAEVMQQQQQQPWPLA